MDNGAYSREGTPTPTDNVAAVTIEKEENEPCCCSSWTRLCDVMGNRQGLFIASLRPLKFKLNIASQRLAILQIELERGMRTLDETSQTSHCIHNLIDSINELTSNALLNIPIDENEMLRHCSNDLAVLARVIDQLIREGSRSSMVDGSTSPTLGTTSEDSFVRKGTQMRNSAAGSSAVDENSLKERIVRNKEMIEKLTQFVDKKTERRWWLRDVINFAQLLVKVALFVSASIAVFYPIDLIFPIITLALTIAQTNQGVIEVLDQYFLKNVQPEDIKMHVITTLSAGSAKG